MWLICFDYQKLINWLTLQHVLNKLPEPPDMEAITSAVKRLEDLGALEDGVCTDYPL